MDVRYIVRNLSVRTRTHLCEELIEIILESKKDKLPNKLVVNILDLWRNKQLITIEKTLSLIKIANSMNSEATLELLNKLGLYPLTEILENEVIGLES
jgi:hypothetical protein